MTTIETYYVKPAVYRPPRINIQNRPQLISGESVIITNVFDFSSIKNITSSRQPEARFDVTEESKRIQDLLNAPQAQNSEITKVVKSTPEKPATVSYILSYLIDITEAQKASNQNVSKVTSIGVQIVGDFQGQTNFANLQAFASPSSKFLLSEILDSPKNKLLLASAEAQRKNAQIPFNSQISVPKSTLDSIDPKTLRAKFSFYNQNFRGEMSEIPEMSFSKKIDYFSDKNAYYAVKQPVQISAKSISFSSTKITITKSRTCRARKVRIYRRLNRVNASLSNQPTFKFLREIDFLQDLDTTLDESYEFSFIDGDLNGEPSSLDNSFSYTYRAIPVGENDAPALIFSETETHPIGQGNVILGQSTKVLPVRKNAASVAGAIAGQFLIPSADPTDFVVTDKNFLAPDAPLFNPSNNLALVGCVRPEEISVSARGFGNASHITFMRKNLTRGEKKFRPVDDRRYVNLQVPNSDEAITYLDRKVVDGQVYEYKIKMMSPAGVEYFGKDTARIKYVDLSRIENDQIGLNTSYSLRGKTVTISIGISFRQSLIDVLSRLLGSRSETDVFLQDLRTGRRDTSPLVTVGVLRRNLTTGQQTFFKNAGASAEMFKKLDIDNPEATDPESPPSLPTLNYAFIDTTTETERDYQYEVQVGVRDKLSITAETTAVVQSPTPYIVQACKVRNPLFLRDGVLPPTSPGKNIISQAELDAGRNRLLNRFTASDELDLGMTATIQPVPETGVIRVPARGGSVRIEEVGFVRPGTSEIDWSWTNKNISHFIVRALDKYSSPFEPEVYNRTTLVALVPAQTETEKGRVSIQASVPHLREGDQLSFEEENLPDMNELQKKVDGSIYGVKRRYTLTPVMLDGTLSLRKVSDEVSVRRVETDAGGKLVTMPSPPPSFNVEDINIDLSKIMIPNLTIAAGLDRVSEVMKGQSFHGKTNYSKIANITPKFRLRQLTPVSPSQGAKSFSAFTKL